MVKACSRAISQLWGRSERAQARDRGQQTGGPEQGKSAKGELGWPERGEGRTWGGPVGGSNQARGDYSRPAKPACPPQLLYPPQVSGLPPSPCSLIAHLLAFAQTISTAWNAPHLETSGHSSVPPRSISPQHTPLSSLINVNLKAQSHREALLIEKHLFPRICQNL